MDDRLAGIRSRTGGPFTRSQARSAGFSEAEIRRVVRCGGWVRLCRGVYVEAAVLSTVRHDPARRHAIEVAGVQLRLDCDAVASGSSAARIWGFETLDRSSAGVVVAADSVRKGEHRDGHILRIAALPGHHCRRRFGVLLTSPARTVVDLARTGSLADGVVVADSALHQGIVSRDELSQMVRECARWPGASRACQVVDLADPGSESVLESVSRVAMHEQGLPAPRTQVTIGDDREPYARVDFLWDEFGIVGEADGLGKYEPDGRRPTRDIVRAEKHREERITDLGYEVVRWGWADATDPPRLAQRLRAAFIRGAQRRRGRDAV